jgi:hypothetical protein
VLRAQVISNGSFLGTVKDQTGAAVPGASVRIFRLGTELQRQKTTDAEGNYQLLDLPVGDYRFEFEKEGFRKVVQTGISLSAGQSLRVDGMFNLFNHSQFSGIGTGLGSATFGQVTSARNPRVSQLALRLTF